MEIYFTLWLYSHTTVIYFITQVAPALAPGSFGCAPIFCFSFKILPYFLARRCSELILAFPYSSPRLRHFSSNLVPVFRERVKKQTRALGMLITTRVLSLLGPLGAA